MRRWRVDDVRIGCCGVSWGRRGGRGGGSRGPAAVLGGDRSGPVERGCGIVRGGVESGWDTLVPEAGGMPPSTFAASSKPLSGRYLAFAEREELAILHAQGNGIREIARQMGRSASTISRELRRNAATRGGGLEYRATTAQWHAERTGRRPKPAKLATNALLRKYVQDRLAGVIVLPSGAAVPGPAVSWKGRRHGPRKNRRWASAWSPPASSKRSAPTFTM